MADPSPLAGLLDRAGHVFALAGQLARAFTDEYDRQGAGFRTVDPTAWSRQRPAFNEFCDALLGLRDEMQNPPDGFAPVAEVLMEAARVARQIHDVMLTTDGQMWQTFLDFRFHFNSVVAKGNEAIRTVTKARRLDDPFAFVDQPTTGKDALIDTTPTPPRPPAALIEKAAQEIPRILADVPPGLDRTVELVAADLDKRLQDAGHTLAAAHWAIHDAVRTGRLQAGLVEVGLPGVGVPNPGWGGPALQWHGGGRATKVIPKGKPAPFDSFKVVATESLWEWWRSMDEANSGEDRPPIGNPEKKHDTAPTVTSPADLQPRKSRMASPDSPEVRAGDPDPLAAFEEFVTTLANCVEPLRTTFMDPYGAAEERWRHTWQVAQRALPSVLSLIRRWFAANLPTTFHLTAEQELAAAEEAVTQFLNCPIPEPALPVGWSEGEDGRLHTPVGGSDPAHREACQRQREAAATALQAVSRLTRWRNWVTPRTDPQHLPDTTAGTAESLPPPNTRDHPSVILLRVFTNGLSDDRVEKASRVLTDDTLTVNEKLTRIDALIPFPATASAEQLGDMLDVTKQAVLKTDWWAENRRGEKESEIGRRRSFHKKRAEGRDPPRTDDGGD